MVNVILVLFFGSAECWKLLIRSVNVSQPRGCLPPCNSKWIQFCINTPHTLTSSGKLYNNRFVMIFSYQSWDATPKVIRAKFSYNDGLRSSNMVGARILKSIKPLGLLIRQIRCFIKCKQDALLARKSDLNLGFTFRNVLNYDRPKAN